MKTIQLTPQQRKDIEQRRRNAENRRIYQRLSVLLWIDDGRPREEVAQLAGVSTRQVGQWLRIFRNKGLEPLCTLHYKGDPGRLRPAQIQKLKHQIAQGGFHNTEQVRTWIEETFGVSYSATGVKELLYRIGASYHKVSGFFWKADVQKQKQFVRKYRRHKREAGPKTRRYFVDACHPVWGVDLLYSCWLLVGQRYYVGVGNGRKRLNILGAYCPDDQDYVDLRLTKENITGEQFVKLLEKLLAKHPDTEKFILYLDNAKYYSKSVVKEWLAAHREFHQGLRIFNIICSKHFGQIVIIPTTSQPLGLEARVGCLLLLQQADGQFPQQRQVLATVARMVPAVILTKYDIQHPVQGVLDPPVATDRLQVLLGRPHEAADVVPHLDALDPRDHAMAEHHTDRRQSLPQLRITQPLGPGDHMALPHLLPTAIRL
ncbi:MAG: IS630 family transposase, partial [Acetobacteraceae bacterium]|nr:IS630 family transposase [Acetobacteraceae bacterium]